jgi:hypothetical protein
MVLPGKRAYFMLLDAMLSQSHSIVSICHSSCSSARLGLSPDSLLFFPSSTAAGFSRAWHVMFGAAWYALKVTRYTCQAIMTCQPAPRFPKELPAAPGNPVEASESLGRLQYIHQWKDLNIESRHQGRREMGTVTGRAEGTRQEGKMINGTTDLAKLPTFE